MKIAYVYDAVYPYRIGGVERRIFEMALRLAERGHEVHIYGLKEWDGASSFSRDGVFYHGVGNAMPFCINGRRSVREAVFFGWRALKPLLHERFDIIDCQNFPYFNCFSMAFVSWIRGSPLVVTWHEVWGDYWYDYLGVKGCFGKMIEKCTASLSDDLVAVSESTKCNLTRLNPRASIEIIPNGIDFQQIDAVQPAANNSDLIFTGRLVREKKADLLIEALVLLKKEIPGIQCIVVGDGPEKKGLIRMCKRFHLEKNLRFTGFIQNHDEVISLMKASKIFAFPSVREGFGMAALEALACGLPVVTSDSQKNAVTELINEKTGKVCRSSPETLAESILTCLEQKDTMKGDCVRMAKLYDWNLIVNKIERYYSDNSRND